MRFGYFYDFRNMPRYHRDQREIYAEGFEHMRAAERLGFASLWAPEHHLTEDGYNPAPLPLLAAMAARTERVQLGTAVLLLPFHHPVLVAEEAAVVDNLSGGRLVLGVALGYRVSEFANLGVDRRGRGARLEEGIEVIRRCWTEERFSFHGRHFQLRDVACAPRPVQRPHPPIVLGARSPAAAVRAARLGLPLMPMGDLPAIHRAWVDAVAQTGAHPAPGQETYSMIAVYPTTDPEREWAELAPYLVEEAVSLRRWNTEAADNPVDVQHGSGDDRDEVERLERSRAIVGEPAYCVRRVEEWAAQAGIDHAILYKGTVSGLPLDRRLEHMELFAREVMPALAGPHR